MTLQLRRISFSPTPVPTLATVLLLALLIWLGLWQLDRARQKQALQQAFSVSSKRPVVPLETLDLADVANRYRRVTAQGRFDNEHQFLLDNQLRHGRPGFHVYTPLKLRLDGTTVLVNRGWVALGESRTELPNVDLGEAEASISGRIGQPANPGILLEAHAGDPKWPRTVQHIDYDNLRDALGYPVKPAVILLDAGSGIGFARDWQPRFGGFGPNRHRGYAVQWFGLASALLIIYLVTNSRWQTKT